MINYPHFRLPEWASTIFVPDGDLDWLSRFSFEAPTNTPELARLKTGFLLRQILDRCEAKIKSALSPNRSIWVYSAHDTTIGNVLNSLGLFEVEFVLPKFTLIFNTIYLRKHKCSYFVLCDHSSPTAHHTLQPYSLNYTRPPVIIICKFSIKIPLIQTPRH